MLGAGGKVSGRAAPATVKSAQYWYNLVSERCNGASGQRETLRRLFCFLEVVSLSRSKANWLLYTPLVAVYLLFVRPQLVGGTELVDKLADVLGLVIMATGLAIRITARCWKLRHGEAGLVTTGPYAVVSNPMYVGSFLIGLGLCVIIGHAAFLAGSAVAFGIVHVLVVRGEERALTAEWPDAYPAYKASVPAWVPSLSRLWGALRQQVSWRAQLRAGFAREVSTICWTVVCALLIDVHEDILTQGWQVARPEATALLTISVLILAGWSVTMAQQRRARVTAR